MHSKITSVASLSVLLKLIMDSKQCDFVFKLEQIKYTLYSKCILKLEFKDQARSSNWKPGDWENRNCALLQDAPVLGNYGQITVGLCTGQKGNGYQKLLTELSCLNQLTDPPGMSPAGTSFAGEAEGWTVPLL